jgi:glutathionyl-hydroquinone reductase
MCELKALESAISVSVSHWAWVRTRLRLEPASGVIPIHSQAKYLDEIYLADDPKSSRRATRRVLCDKAQHAS